MGEFEGRVVIVTGAGSGIGRAVALALGAEGARLILANRTEETGLALQREIGENAFFVPADVSLERDSRSLVEAAVRRWGRLDLAFNNAGYCNPPSPLAEQSLEDFDRCYSVNARGVFLCMKAQIPQMLSGGGGAIVNNSSVNALSPVQGGQAAYTASKFAVTGLTRTAGLDYAAQGIRVNAVAPAGFVTPMLEGFTHGHNEVVAEMLPMRRLPQMREITDVVLWLLSSRSSFLTGHTVPVDGGLMCR